MTTTALNPDDYDPIQAHQPRRAPVDRTVKLECISPQASRAAHFLSSHQPAIRPSDHCRMEFSELWQGGCRGV